MKILWEEGIGADVSTLGEMMYAKAAGIPPSHWVVHGNNKSDEELKFAAENDAWLVVMDEPGEVERCVEFGVKRVLLRITPGIEAGGHEKIMTGHLGSKFGVPLEEAAEIRERAVAAGLEFLGLHVHLGSQLMDDRGRCATRSTNSLCSATAWAGAGDPRPGRRSRNPVRAGRAGAARARRSTRRELSAASAERFPRARVVFEPGRSLVGRAGVALYGSARSSVRGATSWVAVDGGM